jgi:hypothetical protein
MLRVEIFVLLGFLIGFPAGALCDHLIKKTLAARDRRIAAQARRMRVGEALEGAETGELLDALSQRDDLGSEAGRKKS